MNRIANTPVNYHAIHDNQNVPKENVLPPLPTGSNKASPQPHSRAKENWLRRQINNAGSHVGKAADSASNYAGNKLKSGLVGAGNKFSNAGNRIRNTFSDVRYDVSYTFKNATNIFKPKKTQPPAPRPKLTPEEQISDLKRREHSITGEVRNDWDEHEYSWRLTDTIKNRDVIEYMEEHPGCSKRDVLNHLLNDEKFKLECESKYRGKSDWDPGFPSDDAKKEALNESEQRIENVMNRYEVLKEKVALAKEKEEQAQPPQQNIHSQQHDFNAQQEVQSPHYSDPYQQQPAQPEQNSYAYQQPQEQPHGQPTYHYWNGQQPVQPQQNLYPDQQPQAQPHGQPTYHYWNGQQPVQPQQNSYAYQQPQAQPYGQQNYGYWNGQPLLQPQPGFAKQFTDEPQQLHSFSGHTYPQQAPMNYPSQPPSYDSYREPVPPYTQHNHQWPAQPQQPQPQKNSYPTLNGNNLRYYQQQKDVPQVPPNPNGVRQW